MIAPIPGKSAIGVEIPNRYRELVHVRSVLNTARFRDSKMELPVAIGKTIEGEVFVEGAFAWVLQWHRGGTSVRRNALAERPIWLHGNRA